MNCAAWLAIAATLQEQTPSERQRIQPTVKRLIHGGTFDGRRYLKPETIALMTSGHIGPETKIDRGQFYFPGATSGYGLGFAARTSTPPNTSWPLGEYRWDGVAVPSSLSIRRTICS